MADITINKVVIHALVKEQHQQIQDSHLRDAVLDPAHEAVQKTVCGVVDVYATRNNSAHYGVFRSGGEGRGAFPDEFEEYQGLTNPSDQEFLDLSLVAMRRLYDKAAANHAASGGYLLFSDYSNSQGRYFLVAMIKQRPGITLTQNLEPEELMELDLNKLNQAARINFGKLSAYNSADPRDRQGLSYLSFVSPSAARTASGYFVTALGCSEGAAAAQATRNLIKESRKFFYENESIKSERDRFNSDLIEYLTEKEASGASVRLPEIGALVRRHIPLSVEDEADSLVSDLIERLNSEECGVPEEFPVNAPALKGFTKIKGDAPSWSVAFDRSALGTNEAANIYYDRDANRIVLRNVPEKIRIKIEEELSYRGES